MATVGIVANPASGKDIRRLVAYGTVFDNQEKVNIVRRLLLSLEAAGVDAVIYMPDYYGIVPKALQGISGQHKLAMEITPVDICLSFTQNDTFLAAAAMLATGVDCIISLGGDGTNRMLAKGCGQVPILPISTGTNNVFPVMVEGTIAGLAAGVVARGIASGPPAVSPSKRLVIYKNGLPVDIALIDAVVLKDNFIGSRAVWDTERVTQFVVTRGEPQNIGISSIAGNLLPINAAADKGLAVYLGYGGLSVHAPIAPGLVEVVKVKDYTVLRCGESVKVAAGPCLIALDGERELTIQEDDEVWITLEFTGPQVVNVEAALLMAVESGYSQQE